MYVIKNLVLCLCCFGIALTADAKPYKDKVTGLVFPDKIATLVKTSETNFEDRSPGLGISVGYNAIGSFVNIYVYNYRLKSIPEDIQSPVVKAHLKQVFNDVLEEERRGFYKGVKKIEQKVVPLNPEDPKGPKGWLVTMTYKFKEMDIISKIFLTTYKNNFIKVRYSYNAVFKKRAENDFNKLLLFLGNEMKR